MIRLRDEPMVIRTVAGVLLLVLFGLFAALWPGLAEAREPTRCGQHATGIRSDGSVWTGAAPRMWVGRDGHWYVCQPWVPDGGDPEMPEPVAPATCAGGVVIERWGTYPRECLAPRLLPTTPVGAAVVLIDASGGTRGMAAYRCTASGWRVEGSFCNWLHPAQPVPAPSRPRLGGDARAGAASWPGR